MEQVEGGGYDKQNQDGQGSTNMYSYGKLEVALFMAMSHVTVGILHCFAMSLYKERVAGV